LETLVGQFEHTVGTNSFFVRLKRDVDASGGRLLRWLNASEATERFWHGGRKHWLRPDGYAEVDLGGQIQRVFLEWDRGTTRHRQHAIEKFESYAAYIASPECDDGLSPVLLLVTNSPHREDVIWRHFESVFAKVHASPDHFFTSIDTLIGALGPLAPIWRSLETSGRVSWQEGGDRADEQGVRGASRGR
jgi:hypothetical protein